MNRVDQLKAIHTEPLNLFMMKNKDYADSFARHGIIGVLVRLNDKIYRVINVSNTAITLVESETFGIH